MTKKLDNQDTIRSRDIADLNQAFVRFNAALLTLSAHMAADTGLTLSEMAACDHLRLDGPLTPRSLGQRIRLSSGAVTPLIDRLEARGFVTRTPHPTDRRSVLVHYRPQERQVVGRLYAVLEGLKLEAERLGDGERRAVSGFLKTMATSITEATQTPHRRHQRNDPST